MRLSTFLAVTLLCVLCYSINHIVSSVRDERTKIVSALRLMVKYQVSSTDAAFIMRVDENKLKRAYVTYRGESND